MTPERWARVKQLYHEALACSANQRGQRNRTKLAGHAPRQRIQSQAVHFSNRWAVALHDRLDGVAPGCQMRRHAHELHFGAAHARRRNDLQHAARVSALG